MSQRLLAHPHLTVPALELNDKEGFLKKKEKEKTTTSLIAD
jgi:hypothetical protein